MSEPIKRGREPTHPNVILAICCTSLLLVTMDVTIVNVALSSIRRDFQTSISGLQWAIDGYTVVVASFLMLSGSTADRFGRKKIFQFGLGIFTLGSLLCSLAPSTLVLVLCRMIQAVGGSMLNPVAMSIITNTFTDKAKRAQAIGIWGAVVGISMAVGPVLGGILTEHLGWRSIFWINIPIGLGAIALTARYIPESKAAKVRKFDPFAQILIVLGLSTLISALIEGRRVGWFEAPILTAFVFVVLSLVALIVYEGKRKEPLVNLSFFKSIPFSVATVTAVLAFTSFSGFLFLNSLYLQETRGLKASAAGLCLLPAAAAMTLCSPISGRLVGAGHARIATVIAGLAIAVGAFLLSDIGPEIPMIHLLVAYGTFGVGIGLVNAPITNAAVSGMPVSQAGVAAALASTSRQTGAALGVAIAGSIVGTSLKTGGVAFARATHPFWWVDLGCGLAVAGLGILATGKAAKKSVEKISSLLV
jgi:EmrB/QacA subfamily drug resistance transporter